MKIAYHSIKKDEDLGLEEMIDNVKRILNFLPRSNTSKKNFKTQTISSKIDE
jgi:hypothetical protein